MKTSFILFILIVTYTSFFISACDEWKVPKELQGTWSSRTYLKVRYDDENGKYKFVGDTINISITIDQDGFVSGSVGNAELKNCRIEQNRGWFGKTFNLATDYRFIGSLPGKIFSADLSGDKEISAPFNINSETTTGTIFMGSGFAIFPMADLKLQKQ
jgi:hypothetical protein